jgi:hypothetical protein
MEQGVPVYYYYYYYYQFSTPLTFAETAYRRLQQDACSIVGVSVTSHPTDAIGDVTYDRSATRVRQRR